MELADFNRPLDERGQRDIQTMGRYLEAKRIQADMVLCSPACRTRETLTGLIKYSAGSFVQSTAIHYRPEIYETAVADLLSIIQQSAAAVAILSIIGHNPALQQLVEILTDRDFPHPKFSTCGIARIRLHIASWSESLTGRGELEEFIRPKMISTH